MKSRLLIRGSQWLAMLFVAACSSPQSSVVSPGLEKPSSPPSPLARQVAEIAKGQGTAERRQAITRRLTSLGIASREQPFPSPNGKGVNLLAPLPRSGEKTVMLAAHYDRVEVGQGAVDNAAGCAMLLDLLAILKAKPLKNLAVVGAFFDQEEKKMQGSKVFVWNAQQEGKPAEERLPDMCLVFDIFAYGDTLWVSGPQKDSGLAAAAREAAKASGYRLRESEACPPGDHLPFQHAGIDTAAVSLLSNQEIDEVLEVLTGKPPASPPRVLQLIHTPRDTISEVDPRAVEKAVPVIERWLRVLDSKTS